jgi:hypothetical protein
MSADTCSIGYIYASVSTSLQYFANEIRSSEDIVNTADSHIALQVKMSGAGDEALQQPLTGVWTRGLDVVVALLPIAGLVFTTVSKRFYVRTSRSLPMAALAMWFIRLAYFKLPTNYTNAAIIYGLLDALTPMSIIAGAITLFQAMEQTQVRPS